MNYAWNTKNGGKIEIGIDDKLQTKECYGQETRFLAKIHLNSIKINGNELDDISNCNLSTTYHNNKRYIILRLEDAAAKQASKIMKVGVHTAINICINNVNLINWYEHDFPKLKKVAEQKAADDKKTALLKEKAMLKDDSPIEIGLTSSYGYSFPKCLFKEQNVFEKYHIPCSIFDKFRTNVDVGDYTIDYTYKMKYKEFKDILNKVYKDIAPIRYKEQREKEEKIRKEAEDEKLKKSIQVKILKQGKENGGEGPTYYANVEITDPKTKEKLQFSCRNVFDFGYIINPLYEVIKGKQGGIEHDGKWEIYNKENDSYDIRELTEFETRCLKYLKKFPPVYTGTNM